MQTCVCVSTVISTTEFQNRAQRGFEGAMPRLFDSKNTFESSVKSLLPVY